MASCTNLMSTASWDEYNITMLLLKCEWSHVITCFQCFEMFVSEIYVIGADRIDAGKALLIFIPQFRNNELLEYFQMFAGKDMPERLAVINHNINCVGDVDMQTGASILAASHCRV